MFWGATESATFAPPELNLSDPYLSLITSTFEDAYCGANDFKYNGGSASYLCTRETPEVTVNSRYEIDVFKSDGTYATLTRNQAGIEILLKAGTAFGLYGTGDCEKESEEEPDDYLYDYTDWPLSLWHSIPTPKASLSITQADHSAWLMGTPNPFLVKTTPIFVLTVNKKQFPLNLTLGLELSVVLLLP